VRAREIFIPMLVTALLLALAEIVCAPALRAQSQPQTPPPAAAKIADIKVNGSQKHTVEEVSQVSGLKVGDVVTKEQIQAGANRVGKSGLFASVNYQFTTDSTGVHIVFEVEDAEAVPVLFDNFPWFSDAELAEAMRKAIGLFDGTAPPEGAIIDKMSAALQDLLFNRGIHGRVEHTLIERPDGPGDILQFSVAEGAVTKVSGITFTDSLAMRSIEVSARLVDAVGQPYSRMMLMVFDYEQVRPIYLSSGYLKVTFGTPTAVLTGETAPAGEKMVKVTVPITPGAQFHFAGITWSQTSAFTSAALTAMIPLAPGGIADGGKFQGAIQRIIQQYAYVGYLDAQIDPQPQFDDAGAKVAYRAQVTEGPQYKMGNLIVTGLSLDGEKRLRAAWTLAQGTPFDQDYFDNFVSRVKHPSEAIFGNIPVHYDKLGELLRRDEQNHTVDVLLDFQ